MRGRSRPLAYGSHAISVHCYSVRVYHETKELHLFGVKGAFARFCVQSVFSESLQHHLYVFLVFRLIFRVDQDVVEVHDADGVNEVAESLMDIRLKRGRGIGKAKGHDHVFKQAIPGLECRLPFITNGHSYLVVTATKINFREYGCTTKFIQHIIQSWNRVHISNGDGIDGATIHAKTKSVVVLGYQDDGHGAGLKLSRICPMARSS